MVLVLPSIFMAHCLFSPGDSSGGSHHFNAPLKGCSWKSEQKHFLTTSQSPWSPNPELSLTTSRKRGSKPTPPTPKPQTPNAACQSSSPCTCDDAQSAFVFFLTPPISQWSWEHILIAAEDMIDSNHAWDPAETLMASRRNREEGGLRGNLFLGGELKKHPLRCFSNSWWRNHHWN